MKPDHRGKGKNRLVLNIALIGGMERMMKCYRDEANKHSVNLLVFNTYEVDIATRIRSFDGVVIFTNKVSHPAQNTAMQVAKSRNILLVRCCRCRP